MKENLRQQKLSTDYLDWNQCTKVEDALIRIIDKQHIGLFKSIRDRS